MDKLLSIVIPTYNMERYLSNCLQSLIVSEELMQVLEVLVINDGSKDSSSLIAHEFESKYPQTYRVIDKENGNYGSCVNRGVREAKGKYIKILDADDSLNKSTLERYLKLIKDYDVDLILNAFEMVNENGKRIKLMSYDLPINTIISFKDIPFGIDMWMHMVAYKTENLRKINYKQTEGISYTDQEWIFLPMTTVNKVIYTDLSLYSYLVGREGQTMDPKIRAKSIWMITKVLKVMLKEYDELSERGEADDYLNARFLHRIGVIYSAYIFRYPGMNKDELKELDEFLNSSYPKVYKNSNSIVIHKFIPYEYIRHWRKNMLFNEKIARLLYNTLRYYRIIKKKLS